MIRSSLQLSPAVDLIWLIGGISIERFEDDIINILPSLNLSHPRHRSSWRQDKNTSESQTLKQDHSKVEISYEGICVYRGRMKLILSLQFLSEETILKLKINC